MNREQPKIKDDSEYGTIRQVLTNEALRNAQRNGREVPDINDLYNAAISIIANRATPPEAAGRGWIDVKQELPPRHQNIWCLNRDGSMFEGRICCGMHRPFFTYPRGDGSPSNTAPSWIDVTHWQPLPAPPSGEQGRSSGVKDGASSGEQEDE